MPDFNDQAYLNVIEMCLRQEADGYAVTDKEPGSTAAAFPSQSNGTGAGSPPSPGGQNASITP